jgi:hypothetical protein
MVINSCVFRKFLAVSNFFDISNELFVTQDGSIFVQV